MSKFQTRARLIDLLGDQLIGDPQLAVFELVKNSYDADATYARVRIEKIQTSEASILVEDDGHGMDKDTLEHVWLVLGHDNRQKQRKTGRRSPRGRLPLGEKGVGRIATHKLGRHIKIETRKTGAKEVCVIIDWDRLLEYEMLDDAPIDVHERKEAQVFKNEQHGTKISITNLRQTNWTRREVRRLGRYITSMSSPFSGPDDFRAILEVPKHQEWLQDIHQVEEIVDSAPWIFSFTVDENGFDWNYEFRAPPGKKVEARHAGKEGDTLLLPQKDRQKDRVTANEETFDGIGPVSGKFIAFDRENRVLRLYPQVSLIREFLDEQSGVRVYRDGMRVYNYGEPGDDWLGLDLRRVNRPTERISRNIVVGAIEISLEDSFGLREKTNREGFDQNETFTRFRQVVLGIVNKFEQERAKDKKRLRQYLDQTKEKYQVPVDAPLEQLRQKVEKTSHKEELLPLIDRVKKDYDQMRELMLKAGMAGLNLSVVIHEVERGLHSLFEALERGEEVTKVKKQAATLLRMFDTIAGLLKRRSEKTVSLRKIVKTSVNISNARFERHSIQLAYDLPPEDNEPDVKTAFDLVNGVLTNLLDNAIYWLRVRYPDEDNKTGPKTYRKILIQVRDDLIHGWSLVVADNGPGFGGETDYITEPFFTKKPEGMGLGLYYANMAMEICGGQLEFGDRDELGLPREVDGAAVVLHFPSSER